MSTNFIIVVASAIMANAANAYDNLSLENSGAVFDSMSLQQSYDACNDVSKNGARRLEEGEADVRRLQFLSDLVGEAGDLLNGPMNNVAEANLANTTAALGVYSQFATTITAEVEHADSMNQLAIRNYINTNNKLENTAALQMAAKCGEAYYESYVEAFGKEGVDAYIAAGAAQIDSKYALLMAQDSMGKADQLAQSMEQLLWANHAKDNDFYGMLYQNAYDQYDQLVGVMVGSHEDAAAKQDNLDDVATQAALMAMEEAANGRAATSSMAMNSMNLVVQDTIAEQEMQNQKDLMLAQETAQMNANAYQMNVNKNNTMIGQISNNNAIIQANREVAASKEMAEYQLDYAAKAAYYDNEQSKVNQTTDIQLETNERIKNCTYTEAAIQVDANRSGQTYEPASCGAAPVPSAYTSPYTSTPSTYASPYAAPAPSAYASPYSQPAPSAYAAQPSAYAPAPSAYSSTYAQPQQYSDPYYFPPQSAYNQYPPTGY